MPVLSAARMLLVLTIEVALILGRLREKGEGIAKSDKTKPIV